MKERKIDIVRKKELLYEEGERKKRKRKTTVREKENGRMVE